MHFHVNAILLVWLSDCAIQAAARIRISKGDRFGRLEVHVNGEWGLVCNHGWDKTNADVACRELGYKEASPSTPLYSAGALVYQRLEDSMDGMKFLMTFVYCRGSEKSLAQCHFTGKQYPGKECDSKQVVWIKCTSTSKEVRLTNGPNGWQGRVEVFLNGKWGLVCDKNWDMNEGNVVCRQLGFMAAKLIWKRQSYNGMDGMEYLTGNLNCNGREKELKDCHAPRFSSELCNEHDMAGVLCSDESSNVAMGPDPAGNYYKFYWEVGYASLRTARAVCKYRGGNLPSFRTIKEWNDAKVIWHASLPQISNVWADYNKVHEGRWVDSEGHALVTDIVTESSSQPGGRSDCTVIGPGRFNEWILYKYPCSTVFHVFCQFRKLCGVLSMTPDWFRHQLETGDVGKATTKENFLDANCPVQTQPACPTVPLRSSATPAYMKALLNRTTNGIEQHNNNMINRMISVIESLTADKAKEQSDNAKLLNQIDQLQVNPSER